MPKTLAQIEIQIAKLRQQAEALRAKQIGAVVEKIKSMMAQYGLTPADLGLVQASHAAPQKAAKGIKAVKTIKTVKTTSPASGAKSATVKAAKAKRKAAARSAGKTTPSAVKAVKKGPRKSALAKGVIKYRDEAGNEWTGRGKRPGWFLAALAAGKSPQQMLVGSAAA